MYLAGVKLQREFETKIKHVRSLVVTTELEAPPETVRIAERLSDFFNLPRLSMDEATKKHQASMHVSLNDSCRNQITFMLLPQMVEIGPRITLSRLVWEVPT